MRLAIPAQHFKLAINLTILASHIAVEPPMIDEAVEALACAVEVVFSYTQFHETCRDMYMKVVGGKLTLEEEEVLKKLGLRF